MFTRLAHINTSLTLSFLCSSIVICPCPHSPNNALLSLSRSLQHALLVSGNYTRATRARLFSSWIGAFGVLSGLMVYQQVKLNAWKNPLAFLTDKK